MLSETPVLSKVLNMETRKVDTRKGRAVENKVFLARKEKRWKTKCFLPFFFNAAFARSAAVLGSSPPAPAAAPSPPPGTPPWTSESVRRGKQEVLCTAVRAWKMSCTQLHLCDCDGRECVLLRDLSRHLDGSIPALC